MPFLYSVAQGMEKIDGDIGIWSLIAIMIAREIVNYFKHEKMIGQIDKMYTWHDVEDADGMKRWYFPRYAFKEIGNLKEAIEENTKVLREISLRQKLSGRNDQMDSEDL